jgi:hypothetical protein
MLPLPLFLIFLLPNYKYTFKTQNYEFSFLYTLLFQYFIYLIFSRVNLRAAVFIYVDSVYIYILGKKM